MSDKRSCVPCKLISFILLGAFSLFLFVLSLNANYQWEYVKDFVRFRRGFPAQKSWLQSPIGTLRVYLFNITNAERFQNGTDQRMNVEEVGPIVYHIRGHNEILNQTANTLIFRKYYYDTVEFDPILSVSPDILNQTITLPNIVLLSSAAKLYDWVFLVRYAFNAITVNEPLFVKKPINFFLWNFTVPMLKQLGDYLPNIVTNCGFLHNALKPKQELFNVQIGVENGVENFFRVRTFDNQTYFPLQKPAMKKVTKNNDYCPVMVKDTFSSELYPPMLTPQTDLNIMATDSCRTFHLNYVGMAKGQGMNGYRYLLSEHNQNASCLDKSMSIELPQGIFDTSYCMQNGVPTAFSSPHFFQTNYKYNQHYSGFSPNKMKHETYIVIEPNFGVILDIKYRFQLNFPMPDLNGFNKDLQRLSHFVLPAMWYEFTLDDMSITDATLMYFSVHIVPKLQPYIMATLLVLSLISYLNIFLLYANRRLSSLFTIKTNQKTKDCT